MMVAYPVSLILVWALRSKFNVRLNKAPESKLSRVIRFKMCMYVIHKLICIIHACTHANTHTYTHTNTTAVTKTKVIHIFLRP